MADEKREFRAALEEVRGGSADAIWRFIELYGPHIRRIARRNMDPRMQAEFDSLDFVQMVWVSFFRDPRKIRSFRQPVDLYRYLGRMVKNKVCDEHRRRIIAAKRDVTRERQLHSLEEPVNARASSPSQIAIAREQWQRLIEGEPVRNRDIARLRLGGATYVEISRQLGINEKTVRRVIDRLLQSYNADRQDEPDTVN
jgi:RNA polymerase sigma-70 factor (ECF subfamily)